MSIRRACRVLQDDTSTYHYRSRRPGQAVLESRIKEICQTRVRYGYRRVHVLLRREGWPINQKKTRRVYRELGLQLRNKTPKRRVKAKLTRGAYCKFDRSSPDQLKRLLGAVAAYAAGGRSALLKYGRDQGGAAALLTNQMK